LSCASAVGDGSLPLTVRDTLKEI